VWILAKSLMGNEAGMLKKTEGLQKCDVIRSLNREAHSMLPGDRS
jgi:hypothetical protein